MTNTGQLQATAELETSYYRACRLHKTEYNSCAGYVIQVVVTYLAGPIHVCATFDQQLHYFHVTVNGCPYKRCHTKL
jgi:hypothetical protein